MQPQSMYAGYCVEQARSCVEAALIGFSDAHRSALLEMAAHWQEMAAACRQERAHELKERDEHAHSEGVY